MGNELVKQESGITVDVQALISQGLQSKADIGVMERLFAMAKEADAIRARRAFFESLAKLQSEMKTITKTKEVKFTNKTGRVTNYSYAPLEVIVDAVKINLKDNGFSYTLKTVQDATSVAVTCEAHHDAGHTEISSVTVQIDADAYMSGPQKVGAAITYAKRYAFCNAFGILTGDEDTDAVNTDAKQEAKPQSDSKKGDAPPFPEEKYKPSAELLMYQERCKAALEKMTEDLDDKGKVIAFKDTCKAVFGKEKYAKGYFKQLKDFTLDELIKLYEHLMSGSK
jgi:hypothetical protein